jgi:hypothetical protein
LEEALEGVVAQLAEDHAFQYLKALYVDLGACCLSLGGVVASGAFGFAQDLFELVKGLDFHE